jgi:glutamine synthetase
MDLSRFATFRLAACDLNGQMRGKRAPAALARKLSGGSIRMPLSALNVDLWGCDIDNSPLVFATGDADGILHPTERGAVPMPWLQNPSALVPMTMAHDDGTPFLGDPRQALASVLERYSARGWRVMAATEMEFTLLDASGDTPNPPVNPVTGRVVASEAVLSIAQLDSFDNFFSDLHRGAEDMGIPIYATISESGLGQFEVTLNHQNAMRAADDAWLFKTLTRGMARKHGLAATFMAKPYADDAGNGMHVHFSVLDKDKKNVFSDGGPDGSDTLQAAIAGCLAAMPASTLIFAPHGNSYDRLVPSAHAPTGASWAHENRTAAIRIPGGAPEARRIEHRVAGGDINPYLMLATVLGSAMLGIEENMTPPPPITGNAYEVPDLPQLAPDWGSAIDSFASDPLIARILPGDLIKNLVMTKRQELTKFAARPPETHWLSYVESV